MRRALFSLPSRSAFAWTSIAALAAALATASITVPTATVTPPAPTRVHSMGHASKKSDASAEAEPLPPLLTTLVQLHTDERVMLDAVSPSGPRFDELLADRVTGSKHPLDARLLDLLRQMASKHPAARFELVSGYRSPKLNEILRKKGHHVASHSQHSLGHACDFRVVPEGAERGIDPRTLEIEIRALGWQGGVGVYPTTADWFVHADVGPNRRWVN